MRHDPHTAFKGLGVALITPFTPDGQIDFTRLAELVNRVIGNGVDYLLALGTTSEYPTLAPPEKDDVLRCILETNANRLPVMVGLGGPNTQFMIRKLEHLAAFDVDAILTVTPYYNKPSQAGLIAHYKTFAAATYMPVFLYNVPGRTSCNLEAATTLRIAEECPNVVGIKEASGNMSYAMEVAQFCGPDFAMYSGDDDINIAIYAAGGSGTISVFANLLPKESAEIAAKWFAGDTAGALEEHLHYLQLMKKLFVEVNPIPIKAALNYMGLNAGPCRLPLADISEKGEAILKAEMKSLGLI